MASRLRHFYAFSKYTEKLLTFSNVLTKQVACLHAIYHLSIIYLMASLLRYFYAVSTYFFIFNERGILQC